MRHVPTETTHGLNLLSFEASLEQALQPQANYDVNHWLYVPPEYLDYRYILGTRGDHPLVVVGINPSTAAPDALDHTLQSANRIAKANGYDSFLFYNVYAQRATLPTDMEPTLNAALQAENLKAFEYLCKQSCPPHIWAAWGTIVEQREYLMDCMKDLYHIGERYQATWFKAGALSKAGHPHHPLYLKSNTPLEPFDLLQYIQHVSR